MPWCDDSIERLHGAKYYSLIDLLRGYWQIPLAADDRPKTAFSTPSGLYEWNYMGMGLKSAPRTFSRVMKAVLGELEAAGKCIVFLDNICVLGATWEDHLDNLSSVLQALFLAGLRAKKEKSQFGVQKVVFLGHKISPTGMQPDSKKLTLLETLKTPQNKKQLRSVLGFCSYYRKFVPGFARIAKPLHALTKE